MENNLTKTEIGILPSDWEVVLLDNVAERNSGHTPNKKIADYWNGDIPWISLKDLSRLNKRYINETTDYTTSEGIKNSSAVLLPKGTIVISRDATVGKIGILSKEMATSQHFINYVCGERLDNMYLYYYLLFKNHIFEQIATGSTIKTIGLGFFKKLKIAVPPINEQKKIANILSTWDEAIELNEKLIEQKKEQKKGLMQKLLKGEDRFPGFVGEWSNVVLGEVFEITSGKSKTKYIESGGKFLIVDMGAISTNGKLISKKPTNHKKDILNYGDLVMAKDDIGGGNIIGKVVFIDEDNRYVLGDHVYKLKALEGDSKFLSYLINSYKINKSFRKKASGTAQLGLGRKEVENQLLTIPSLEEQKEIAKLLSEIDKQIELLIEEVGNLEQQKKGLMQLLLTGKIRVCV